MGEWCICEGDGWCAWEVVGDGGGGDGKGFAGIGGIGPVCVGDGVSGCRSWRLVATGGDERDGAE